MSKSSVVSEVLSKVSIKEIAETVTTLKKKGGDYWGLSPFITENTPSFKIDEKMGTFYCFATKTGGGILELYSLINNVSKRDALIILAEEHGIEIETKEDDSEIAAMYRCLKAAHNIFLENQHVAVEYFASDSRNLSADVVESYEIGYAPKDSKYLINSLRYQGFSDEIILACSLATKMEDGNLLAFYYDRIIFPIKDPYGKIISFSGRRMLDVTADGEKVVNPEKYRHGRANKIFKKENILWGIERARKEVRKKGYMIGVEGFMDAIPSQLAGEPTVALLGAIPSKSQLAQIARYTQDFYICSDADKAGKEALVNTFFSVEELGLDMIVYSVILPEEKDPGEYIAKHGQEAFSRLIRSAIPDTANIVEITVAKHAATSTKESALIRKVMEELVPHTKQMTKFSYKAEDLIERLAQAFGISRKELREWLQNNPSLAHNSRVYKKIEEIKFDAPAYERRLLIEAIRNPNVTYMIRDAGISLQDFDSPLVARTLGHIFKKPMDTMVFEYLKEVMKVEDYNEVFVLYHDANQQPLSEVESVIGTMQSVIERRRKFTPQQHRLTNFLGKPLTPLQKEQKAVVRDILLDNEIAEEPIEEAF